MEIFGRLTGAGSENRYVAKFGKRVLYTAVAFFVVGSFGPLYQLTEGYGFDVPNYTEYTDQELENILDNFMTEDGFIYKPNLNITQGDRSEFNEIFAYEVEPGDTVTSLAQRFGISAETIKMENNLWNDTLRAGSTLKILPVDGISHLVKKGDTLSKIAKKYEVDIEKIKTQNQLKEDDQLIPETALIIPGGKRVVAPPSSPGRGSVGGAKPPAFNYSGASGRLLFPTSGGITQYFNARHYAIDIGNRSRPGVYAAESGVVIKAATGYNGGYGNHIILDHGDGMQTLYAHNDALYVKEGQHVERGQLISKMGNTGRVYGATGIHLHFEVRINGVKYDPMKFFSK